MKVLGHIEDKPHQCVVKTSFVKTLKIQIAKSSFYGYREMDLDTENVVLGVGCYTPNLNFLVGLNTKSAWQMPE